MESRIPLSQMQYQIWMGQQLHPRSPMYNMVFTFAFECHIDKAAFTTAFTKVVTHSDALRTRFIKHGDIPFQEVQQSVDYSVDYLEIESQNFDAWINEQLKVQFDLTGTLFICKLIKLTDKKYIWYLNIHHCIVDAWAFTVIYDKWRQYYLEALSGVENLNIDHPQFANFLFKYETNKKSKRILKAGNHWKANIEGIEPNGLKLYENSLSLRNTDANRYATFLTEDQTAALKVMSNDRDLKAWSESLFYYNVFLTIYYAFLHRLSKNNEILIGSPSHNRSTQDYRNTIGVFIEFFPLKVSFDENESFGSLYQKVKKESLSFLKSALPGSSSPETSRSYSAVFNFINAAFESSELPVKATWVHPNHIDANHAIRLHVSRFNTNEGFKISFDIQSDLIGNKKPDYIISHFNQLMNAFIRDRSTSIHAVTLPGKAEIDSINRHSIGPIRTFPPSIMEGLDEIFHNYGQQIAIRSANSTYTYEAFNLKINQVANYLIKLPNDRPKVVLYLERSYELVCCIMACLRVGAAFIPIPKSNPEKRTAFILNEIHPDLIITNDNEILNTSYSHLSITEIKESSIKVSPAKTIKPDDLAYVLYTSGSTGTPKGVRIKHENLSNYLYWASEYYKHDGGIHMPFCTSVGFDLTITSLLLPFLNGGSLSIYAEAQNGPDLAVVEAIKDANLTTIKLTPSHIRLLDTEALQNTTIKAWIVGGEQFPIALANKIYKAAQPTYIVNEYGPTEATVGCIAHKYNYGIDQDLVPIGAPIANMEIKILDDHQNPVPIGTTASLYLKGKSLSAGYVHTELEETRFISLKNVEGIWYNTGDTVKLNSRGELIFLGRTSEYLKVNGKRIARAELESNIQKIPGIESVYIHQFLPAKPVEPIENCLRCGLPSNYPSITFTDGICSLCTHFDAYQKRVEGYFSDLATLERRLKSKSTAGEYDCLVLLSGGKDSSYALSQIAKMGLRILSFTLDNGYISEYAKDNVRHITNSLNVDHIFGQTEHMNAIFVDSLERFHNVCNGCFKTIYTLATQIALEKNIPFIITGLSRGQFFETRLSEELFWNENVDYNNIDTFILEARKQYHRTEDAVNNHLDCSFFEHDDTFEKVEFVDFYRYCDVRLEDMIDYLENTVQWRRPEDTGRSTNCLINEAGIFEHKKQTGYHNYAYPYSWDVRIGHKSREETLHEINEDIDPANVKRIFSEIGYKSPTGSKGLICYYTANTIIGNEIFSATLEKWITNDLHPSKYIQVDTFPLTANGKLNVEALIRQDSKHEIAENKQKPVSEFEVILMEIWTSVLEKEDFGIHDTLLSLGGQSLEAIRLMSRINEAFELDLSLRTIFDYPTIHQLANYIEATIRKLLAEME